MLARLALTVVLLGCGTRSTLRSTPAPPPAATDVTRWIPADVTYAFAARSVRLLQDTVRDRLGAFVAVPTAVAALFDQLDPLSPDALASLGIDIDAPIAVYAGADLRPTIVVRLADRARADRWLARHEMAHEIAAGWLLIHTRPDHTGGTRFTATPPFELGPRAFAGTVDLSRLHGCLAPFANLRASFGVTLEGAALHALVRAALPASSRASLVAAILPPPGPWAAPPDAPVAVEWNLDLRAVSTWLAPCRGPLPDPFAQLPVRAVRAVIEAFDPHEQTGRAAVSLELVDPAPVRALLDEIPLRSTLESSRTFGIYRGKHLAIPFGPTIDYVLADNRAIAGLGDGVLARMLTGPPRTSPPPILHLSVAPAGLAREAWSWLLERADMGWLVDPLLAWRRLAATITVDDAGIQLELTAEPAYP